MVTYNMAMSILLLVTLQPVINDNILQAPYTRKTVLFIKYNLTTPQPVINDDNMRYI